MKYKYNLALVPLSISDEVINLAKKLSYLADKYLLGHDSLPHITLYQFHADENDINSIWEKVCNGWSYESLDLTFAEFSCVTFDDQIHWVSLMPDKRDILHEMHEYVARAITMPVKNVFDPHMTLFNTKNKEYQKDVIRLYGSRPLLKDRFILSLGISDDIGQFKKIIYVI